MSAVVPPVIAERIVAQAQETDGSRRALDAVAGRHGMTLTELEALIASPPKAEPTKACTKCGQTKPLSEFFANPSTKDGRASWCRVCNNKRERTPARMVEGRARGRAYRRLAKAHPEEFDRLFAEETAAAIAEHERVQAAAAARGQADAPVARLRSGPKRREETDAVQRLDVARCRTCHTHHDAGHACPGCGEVTREPR